MSDTTKVPVRYRAPTKEIHHGKTGAAWAGVVIAFIGFAVLSVGIVLSSALIVIISLGVLALSLVAVLILRAVGFGSD